MLTEVWICSTCETNWTPYTMQCIYCGRTRWAKRETKEMKRLGKILKNPKDVMSCSRGKERVI